MKRVVDFTAYLERSNVKTGSIVRSGPAQLLLFTGVRYERHTTSDDLPEPERGGGTQLVAGSRRRRRRA